jgi:hypothetical protein
MEHPGAIKGVGNQRGRQSKGSAIKDVLFLSSDDSEFFRAMIFTSRVDGI